MSSDMTPEQRELINSARKSAWRRNIALANELARADQLATPSRLRRATAEARQVMLRTLDQETAHGLVRAYLGESKPVTAAEMFEIMRQWINDYQDPKEMFE